MQNLARDAGIEADLVEAAVQQRKAKYHKMYAFDDRVMEEVQLSRQNTILRTDSGWQRGVGYFRGPTNCLFAFTEDEAPEWLQKKGIHTSFSPTCVKNYPSQGLGGEIMQVMAGLIFRAIFRHNLEHDILLINTVHDSVYLDFRTEELAKKYLPLIAGIMEQVCRYFNSLYTDCNWNTPFPVDADYGESIYDANNSVKDRDTKWFDELMAA